MTDQLDRKQPGEVADQGAPAERRSTRERRPKPASLEAMMDVIMEERRSAAAESAAAVVAVAEKTERIDQAVAESGIELSPQESDERAAVAVETAVLAEREKKDMAALEHAVAAVGKVVLYGPDGRELDLEAYRKEREERQAAEAEEIEVQEGEYEVVEEEPAKPPPPPVEEAPPVSKTEAVPQTPEPAALGATGTEKMPAVDEEEVRRASAAGAEREANKETGPKPTADSVLEKMAAVDAALKKVEGAGADASAEDLAAIEKQLAELTAEWAAVMALAKAAGTSAEKPGASAAAKNEAKMPEPAAPRKGPPPLPDSAEVAARAERAAKMVEAGQRWADAEAALKRFEGFGRARLLTAAGRAERDDLLARLQVARFDYGDFRAEYVGDSARRMLDERERQVEARRAAIEKEKGLSSKVYDAYKKLGEMNLTKLGWQPKGRLGRFVARVISVRTGISLGLLGAGLAFGATPAVGIAAIAGRRVFSGLGASYGSYDLMKILAARSDAKLTPEDIGKMKAQEVSDRMDGLEAAAMIDGRPLAGNEVYKNLQARLEFHAREMQEREARNPEHSRRIIERVMRFTDERLEETRRRSSRNDKIMKGMAGALGVFVGSGALARVVSQGVHAGIEKAGLAPAAPAAVEAAPARLPPPAEAVVADKPAPIRMAEVNVRGKVPGAEHVAAAVRERTIAFDRGGSVVGEGNWRARLTLDARGVPKGFEISATDTPAAGVSRAYLMEHSEAMRRLAAGRNLDAILAGEDGKACEQWLARVYEEQRLLDELNARGFGESPAAKALRASIEQKMSAIDRATSGAPVRFEMPKGLDPATDAYDRAEFGTVDSYQQVFVARGVGRESLERLVYSRPEGQVEMTDASGRGFKVPAEDMHARAAASRELNALRSGISGHAGGRFTYGPGGRVSGFEITGPGKPGPYALLKPQWTVEMRSHGVPWERVEEVGKLARRVVEGRQALAAMEAAGDGQTPEANFLRSGLSQDGARLAELTRGHNVMNVGGETGVKPDAATAAERPAADAAVEARPTGPSPVRFTYDSTGRIIGYTTAFELRPGNIYGTVLREDFVKYLKPDIVNPSLAVSALEMDARSLSMTEQAIAELERTGRGTTGEASVLRRIVRDSKVLIRMRYGEVLR